MRAQLLEYARLYYPDRIRDFSESSMGGLLLDFAAAVGDNLSFYLDHQYAELDGSSAVETVNIERALRAAGVPIVGAAAALVPVTVYVRIPAENIQNVIVPSPACVPVVQAGSVFSSDSGVDFNLVENIDFNVRHQDGRYVAQVRVDQRTNSGTPTSFIMAHHGLCISGKEIVENVSIGKQFVPFRQVTLSNANVTEIVSVVDGYGNVYYQVSSLSDDVVYRNVLNTSKDNDVVRDAMKVMPAPYRYVVNTDLATRRTTLTFGGGNANTLEDDVIPDPSEFALALPYTRTFSRVPVNPSSLLQTKTLGVAAADTVLQINYRYGGGLNHCVPANSVRNVKTLKLFFPGNPSPALAANVRNSVEASNSINASGGDDAPSADDLKALIPSIRNSQERIVSREDLLARVYTLPSNFGRVFRAAIRSNPTNPNSTLLFIISRDPNGRLSVSPDTLKRNLRTYLNPYRMISDAIDVLDARVINLTLNFDVLVDPALNRSIVLQNVLTRLQPLLNIKNFHIDQPLNGSDIRNAIFSVSGIVAVNNVTFNGITGVVAQRTYSDETFDVSSNTYRGLVFPPPGSIFEFRYPEYDVVGKASV